MAKYRIGNNGKNDVNCELLTESAGKYIVRFGNGMIKGVEKDRIHSLDPVDVDVLKLVNESKLGDLVKGAADKVGEFGRRVGAGIKSAVESIWNFIVKGNNRIFFVDESGKIEQSIHPINAMLAAGEGKNIGYMPSEDVIEMANQLNITPKRFDYEFAPYEYQGSAVYATDFLSSGVNESLLTEADAVFDSSKFYEEQAKDLIFMESGDFQDVDEDFILEELNLRYNERINPTTRDFKNTALFLWGAPGIGKTSILNAFKKSHPGSNVLTVMASNIEPEAFTMPAKTATNFLKNIFSKKKDDGIGGEDRLKAGDEYIPASKLASAINKGVVNDDGRYDDSEIEEIRRLNQNAIEDLPKSWLPVYNKNVSGVDPSLRTSVLRDRIRTADGGQVTDKGVHAPGKGGVFFIDEFSRLSQSGLTSIFDFPLSRTLGVNSDLVLGPKWFVVCAGNRVSDMGPLKKLATKFDSAAVGRYLMFNFVPKYEEWRAWASKAKGGFSNVNKHIVEFIDDELSKGFKAYYCVYRSDNAEKNLNTTKPQASPRRWEQLSNYFISYAENKFGEIITNSDGDEYKGIPADKETDDIIFDVFKADRDRFKVVCEAALGVVIGDKFNEFIFNSLYGFGKNDLLKIINDVDHYTPNKEVEDRIKKAFSSKRDVETYINSISGILSDAISDTTHGGYVLDDDGVASLIKFFGKCAGHGGDKTNTKTFITLLLKKCGYDGLSNIVADDLKFTSNAIQSSFGTAGKTIIKDL